jgi:chemotaxis protein histidine kinase CheA
MNNTALISVSLIVLFGLTACSNNSRTAMPAKVSPTAKVQNNTQYISTQKVPTQTVTKAVTNNRQPNQYQQQWAAKQKAEQAQKEQKRLAYNRNWQNQQRQLAQQQANERAKQTAQAHARKVWQQQEARNKANKQAAMKQIAQEKAARQRAEQYRATQQRAAAQQIATQQRAAQQRANQQRATQQQRIAQQYAMLQQQNRQNTQQRQQSNGRGISGLSESELRAIGDKIFRNESGGDIDKLVHWNIGENFASMGIGHFTWYPAGRRNRYGNTFPGLLDHLQSNGVRLPVWVQKARHTGAPWRTKGELARAKSSSEVREFQNLLYQTRNLQASYIFDRAKRAMPRLVKTTPKHLQGHVAQNLNAVANTRGGWYALIDYVNFKGEGLSRKGGYRGQNWGLLQVLENMKPSQPGQMALNNFADSAIHILTRRVRNSDPKRNEARWLRGWTVRCNTYRHPFVI